MSAALNRRILAATIVAWAALAAASSADPANQYLRFVQEPMVALDLGGTADPQIYYGHDERSTAYFDASGSAPRFVGTFVADDFACRSNQSIIKVQWWGSYIGAAPAPNSQVKRFLIAFERDTSQPGDLFGRPGDVLSSQVVTLSPDSLAPAPGSFTEMRIRGPDPYLNESLYEYRAELAVPCEQTADTVYWLKIVALVDPGIPEQKGLVWGWHTRDYTASDPLASTPPAVHPGEHIQGHVEDAAGRPVPVWHFQNDAIAGRLSVSFLSTPGADGASTERIVVTQRENTFGPLQYVYPYDGPPPVMDYSTDLAFALYAVPEPSTVVLLSLGLGSLCGWRRTRRR